MCSVALLGAVTWSGSHLINQEPKKQVGSHESQTNSPLTFAAGGARAGELGPVMCLGVSTRLHSEEG